MQRRGARKGSQHVPSPEPVDITAQIDGQLDDVADFHAGSDEIAAEIVECHLDLPDRVGRRRAVGPHVDLSRQHQPTGTGRTPI